MMDRRLYKSNGNKMIDGVCGGIAEYFGIDPTLVRLGWVLFCALGGGFGNVFRKPCTVVVSIGGARHLYESCLHMGVFFHGVF